MKNRLLSELIPWSGNLRTGEKDGDKQTGDIVELLGVDLEPLAVMPDGTVLDGNGRLPIYLEKGFVEAPVIEVDITKNELDDLWYVSIDGKHTKARFNTKEDGMQYIAMARNHKPRYLDPDKVKAEADNYGIDWNAFSASLQPDSNAADLIASLKKEVGPVKPVTFKYEVVVQVNDQQAAGDLINNLTGQGYFAKVKTKTR